VYLLGGEAPKKGGKRKNDLLAQSQRKEKKSGVSELVGVKVGFSLS